MSYTIANFRNKKLLLEAVESGERVEVAADFIGGVPEGKVFLEGPHSPAAHTWYATAIVKNGVVVSVY